MRGWVAVEGQAGHRRSLVELSNRSRCVHLWESLGDQVLDGSNGLALRSREEIVVVSFGEVGRKKLDAGDVEVTSTDELGIPKIPRRGQPLDRSAAVDGQPSLGEGRTESASRLRRATRRATSRCVAAKARGPLRARADRHFNAQRSIARDRNDPRILFRDQL